MLLRLNTLMVDTLLIPLTQLLVNGLLFNR